ncbi:hypothetical protein PNOK_0672700 [Pyrrhoderma noxium]|uniref:Uncharacterized protein n=1 Tax=Pyrrhoderma noxium TaxID=2282107 RepID=A0A286UF71_9AGAM|nr:hypothetical protein PNOK_0672700 [Pyrrhoderma noxium]
MARPSARKDVPPGNSKANRKGGMKTSDSFKTHTAWWLLLMITMFCMSFVIKSSCYLGKVFYCALMYLSRKLAVAFVVLYYSSVDLSRQLVVSFINAYLGMRYKKLSNPVLSRPSVVLAPPGTNLESWTSPTKSSNISSPPRRRVARANVKPATPTPNVKAYTILKAETLLCRGRGYYDSLRTHGGFYTGSKRMTLGFSSGPIMSDIPTSAIITTISPLPIRSSLTARYPKSDRTRINTVKSSSISVTTTVKAIPSSDTTTILSSSTSTPTPTPTSTSTSIPSPTSSPTPIPTPTSTPTTSTSISSTTSTPISTPTPTSSLTSTSTSTSTGTSIPTPSPISTSSFTSTSSLPLSDNTTTGLRNENHKPNNTTSHISLATPPIPSVYPTSTAHQHFIPSTIASPQPISASTPEDSITLSTTSFPCHPPGLTSPYERLVQCGSQESGFKPAKFFIPLDGKLPFNDILRPLSSSSYSSTLSGSTLLDSPITEYSKSTCIDQLLASQCQSLLSFSTESQHNSSLLDSTLVNTFIGDFVSNDCNMSVEDSSPICGYYSEDSMDIDRITASTEKINAWAHGLLTSDIEEDCAPMDIDDRGTDEILSLLSNLSLDDCEEKEKKKRRKKKKRKNTRSSITRLRYLLGPSKFRALLREPGFLGGNYSDLYFGG